MSDRIEIVEVVKLSHKREIRTKEIIENPNEKDILGVKGWLELCEIGRIEILRPAVEICDGVGSVVDYARSEMTTITIKLKGE